MVWDMLLVCFQVGHHNAFLLISNPYIFMFQSNSVGYTVS